MRTMLLAWLAATALSSAFARSGRRRWATRIRSIRQSVAASTAAAFVPSGVRPAPGHAAAAPTPRGKAASVPVQANMPVASVAIILLPVLGGRANRVQEWLQTKGMNALLRGRRRALQGFLARPHSSFG